MQVKTKTVTTRSFTQQFDREMLIRALNLPADAEVYVTVPGGGDWSNCELRIEDDVPLEATWTEREES